jgi:hypothetical protein
MRLEQPPIEIWEPAFDLPVLDHWAGVYDYVYFILNPLFRVPWHVGLPDHLRQTVEGQEWVKPLRTAWETPDFDTHIKAQGQALTWRALHSAVSPESSFRNFALTLWLSTVNSPQLPEVDQVLWARILSYCQDNAWFWPDENDLPPILQPAVGAFFIALHVTTLDAYSEFRDHHGCVSVGDLQSGPATTLTSARGHTEWINCLHAPTPGAVMIWSFDDTSAVLGMTHVARERADPTDFFECVAATPSMKTDWIRQL